MTQSFVRLMMYRTVSEDRHFEEDMMEKTSSSGEPGPRKIDAYGSLQAKGILVGVAFFLTCVFGPIPLILTLIACLIGTIFSGKMGAIEASLWQWLLVILCCALALPLYRLERKLMRQLKELRDQME